MRPWTLLLTDVVDSTAIVDRLGPAAASELWARHDTLARALLEPHGGREIDKTDGFLHLFETADDAVAYAFAYHAALTPLGIRARAGVHTGEVVLRVTPQAEVARGAKPLEVDGPAKPTAARIMALARGGQTLLSEEARRTFTRPAVSHGHFRLKGVAQPVEVFEAAPEGAACLPPEDGPKAWRVVASGLGWVAVADVAHNLPAERDPFVGREQDLGQLAEVIDKGARLVTLVGAGGSGKTRLALRYARGWLGEFSGGALFVDLTDARDEEGIVRAVAQALALSLGSDDPVTQVGHALAARGRCLVVLDNFEQVAAHAPQTLSRWLDRVREATFLVTSREVLRIAGEALVPVQPLELVEARELFVLRTGNPALASTPEIPALLRLLDGLPLAIELAAARARTMSPKDILARMGERFRLLSSGPRDRRATLLGAIDWSWQLLNEPERRGLAQVSIFTGGFTLPALEAVLDGGDAWPADVIQGLADKSLVRASASGRFDLLVSIRDYATDRLRDLDRAEPGLANRTRDRHAAWFGGWCADASTEALQTDHENLTAALDRAIVAGEARVAATLWLSLWRLAEWRGPWAPLLSTFARIPPLEDPDVSCELLSRFAYAAIETGDLELAVRETARAVALAPRASPRTRAYAYLVRARSLWTMSDRVAAEEACVTGVACAREAGDGATEDRLILIRAAIWLPTDPVRFGIYIADAEARAVRRGSWRLREIARFNRTLAGFGSRPYAESRAEFEQMLVRVRAETDSGYVAMYTLHGLAQLLTLARQDADALLHAQEALEMSRVMGHPKIAALMLVVGGLASVRLGDPVQGLQWVREGLALGRPLQDRLDRCVRYAGAALAFWPSGAHEEARAALAEAMACDAQLGIHPETNAGLYLEQARTTVIP